jgi:hypothetical protein
MIGAPLNLLCLTPAADEFLPCEHPNRSRHIELGVEKGVAPNLWSHGLLNACAPRLSLRRGGRRSSLVRSRKRVGPIPAENCSPGMSHVCFPESGLPPKISPTGSAGSSRFHPVGPANLCTLIEIDGLLRACRDNLMLGRQRLSIVRQSRRVFARTVGELRQINLQLRESRELLQETLARSRAGPAAVTPEKGCRRGAGDGSYSGR